MKELQTEFIGIGEVRGFMFRQLLAGKQAYLYSVTNDNTTWYEVFERLENRRFNTVSYPSSPAFGTWAYCISDIEKAKAKFERLENKVKDSKIRVR